MTRETHLLSPILLSLCCVLYISKFLKKAPTQSNKHHLLKERCAPRCLPNIRSGCALSFCSSLHRTSPCRSQLGDRALRGHSAGPSEIRYHHLKQPRSVGIKVPAPSQLLITTWVAHGHPSSCHPYSVHPHN
jgi:hypothetical protein